jgi:GxxExxY protein
MVRHRARPRLEAVDTAQLLNYLRATEIEVGLLLNFGPRPEFKRLVFSSERKGGRGSSNTAIRRP